MTAMKTLGKLAVLGLAVFGAIQIWTRLGGPGARAVGRPGLSPAPTLSLPDVSGKAVDLDSLRGRAVAVNFWATWCPPCRFEIPELAAFYRENRDRCFEMLGVAEDSGGRDEVEGAARALGISYPVLLDGTGDAARRFGVAGLPHTVIVDAGGAVRRVFQGAIGKEQLESALGPLLPPHGAPCPRS